jgi:hypothetical protein
VGSGGRLEVIFATHLTGDLNGDAAMELEVALPALLRGTFATRGIFWIVFVGVVEGLAP